VALPYTLNAYKHKKNKINFSKKDTIKKEKDKELEKKRI